MSKVKKLCGLKKDDIEKQMEKILKIVSEPKYICEKCARVAKDDEHLCHPLSFKKAK